jgi:hypothetical protein
MSLGADDIYPEPTRQLDINEFRVAFDKIEEIVRDEVEPGTRSLKKDGLKRILNRVLDQDYPDHQAVAILPHWLGKHTDIFPKHGGSLRLRDTIEANRIVTSHAYAEAKHQRVTGCTAEGKLQDNGIALNEIALM